MRLERKHKNHVKKTMKGLNLKLTSSEDNPLRWALTAREFLRLKFSPGMIRPYQTC